MAKSSHGNAREARRSQAGRLWHFLNYFTRYELLQQVSIILQAAKMGNERKAVEAVEEQQEKEQEEQAAQLVLLLLCIKSMNRTESEARRMSASCHFEKLKVSVAVFISACALPFPVVA